MRLGIDWVSAALFVGAYLFSLIRAVPIRLRYAGLSAACGVIAVHRLRLGAVGPNQIFVGVAVLLTLYYAFRAVRSVNR
jgi:hypothetical protein